MRDFKILLASSDPESPKTLAELARLMTRMPGLGRYRTRRGKVSKNAVLKLKARCLARLPGRWHFAFSTGGYATRRAQGPSHGRSFSGTNERKNRVLQERVPLPESLQFHVAAGARDRIIARLHFFRMPTRDIAELAGAPEGRVKGVIQSALAQKVAAELSEWLEQKARPRVLDSTPHRP